jgi:hypothetical protein
MKKMYIFFLLALVAPLHSSETSRINDDRVLARQVVDSVKAYKAKTKKQLDDEIAHILCHEPVEMGFARVYNHDDCPITPPDSPSEMK